MEKKIKRRIKTKNKKKLFVLANGEQSLLPIRSRSCGHLHDIIIMIDVTMSSTWLYRISNKKLDVDKIFSNETKTGRPFICVLLPVVIYNKF